MNFKQMHLTKFVLKIPPGARTGTLRKAWEKEEMTKKWEETTWAKKIALRGLVGFIRVFVFIYYKERLSCCVFFVLLALEDFEAQFSFGFAMQFVNIAMQIP